MARYEKFENQDKVFVEQNIFDNNELESYEPVYEINGEKKTSVLYYFETEDNKRFYALGLLENLKGDNVRVVENDLSEILKFKTAKTRRKYISQVIRNNANEYITQ